MPVIINGTTGIQLPDGTAANPAIRGTTSANTGVYFPAANTVGISANSTLEMFVDATGPATGTGQYISAVGMKNRIINGDFKIDQRFNGAANNNISGVQYVVDRWYVNGISAAKLRFQQNNTNGPGSAATQAATGFPYYFGANVVSSNTVSAGDYWNMAQPIEGLNIADLGWGTANASPVTLSFWVYSSVPGLHSVSLNNGFSARSYPATYTISTANTWQRQTITIPGDTTGTWFSNNSAGMYVIFNSFGSGSNWAAGSPNSWNTGGVFLSAANNVVQTITAANGSFYITGVQLEKGSVATPFEFRHYTTEFSLCERYHRRDIRISGGLAGTTSIVYANMNWNGMRTVPNILGTGPLQVYNGGSNFTQSSFNASISATGMLSGINGALVIFGNFTGLTQGNPIIQNNNANANYLVLDAEL